MSETAITLGEDATTVVPVLMDVLRRDPRVGHVQYDATTRQLLLRCAEGTSALLVLQEGVGKAVDAARRVAEAMEGAVAATT